MMIKSPHDSLNHRTGFWEDMSNSGPILLFGGFDMPYFIEPSKESWGNILFCLLPKSVNLTLCLIHLTMSHFPKKIKDELLTGSM